MDEFGEVAGSLNGGEFIVNLVSNASMAVYKDNRMASFTTLLPGKGINLPIKTSGGYWEVALSEINFPSKFYNVMTGSFAFTSKRLKGEVYYDQLPKGRYSDIYSILSYIDRSWKRMYDAEFGNDPAYADIRGEDILAYRFDKVTNKLEIKMMDDEAHLIIRSEDIRAILGYNYESGMNDLTTTSLQALGNDGWVTADYAPDFQRLHTALVYTDIIEHQIIGDTLAPLLRVVPMVSKMKNGALSTTENSQIAKTFSLPLQFKKSPSKLVPFYSAGNLRREWGTDPVCGCRTHSSNDNIQIQRPDVLHFSQSL
jgi:hypothetical protein